MDLIHNFLYFSRMTDVTQEIQNYNLFGESAELPDVVHCESIAMRSRLHDWVLKPHRHARLHQVLLVTSGAGQASIEGVAHALRPGLLINMPAGIVHGYEFDPGTDGHVLTLANEMLDEVLKPTEGLMLPLSRISLLDATGEDTALLDRISQVHAGRAYARAHELRSLVSLMLGHIARRIAEASDARAPVTGTGLPQRFQDLVERYFRQHLSLGDYADALGITASHLSRVCRTDAGQSASRIVTNRIIQEARRNLVYTDLPVSRIAYDLGYDDPAYFSRVFTRATGMAPRKFRERAGFRHDP